VGGGLDARSQYVVLRQGEKWEKYVWNAVTLKVKRPEMNERVTYKDQGNKSRKNNRNKITQKTTDYNNIAAEA
jgi:hypothetical protein